MSRNQPEVQQSRVPEVLIGVHLWRRVAECKETPETLMRIGCALRPPQKSLLSRDIHLPGPATHLACLELQPRFGVIEPAELVGSRIAVVSQPLGRIAEFFHDRDARVVAEAEINAMEFIATEVLIG